jgi:hypothetical protein
MLHPHLVTAACQMSKHHNVEHEYLPVLTDVMRSRQLIPERGFDVQEPISDFLRAHVLPSPNIPNVAFARLIGSAKMLIVIHDFIHCILNPDALLLGGRDLESLAKIMWNHCRTYQNHAVPPDKEHFHTPLLNLQESARPCGYRREGYILP